MLRKSSILLSCNTLHPSPPPHSCSCGTSTTSPYSHHRQRQPRVLVQTCRSYAMVSDGPSRHNHGELRWPEKSSIDRVPTPYQIFDQKKGSAYSKKRFYELVKLYHPDRHEFDSAASGLSQATKMERYRLVVAANEILSDPIKRSAFDMYGAGWNGMPGVRTSKDYSNSNSAWEGGWRQPNGPSRNATWEDWERWHERNNPKEKQEPQFVSNGAFVSLIVMFAVLGGVGQATRVGNFSMTFVEQRDALHKNISSDLNRRRKETTTLWGTREERIDNFLRHRAPVSLYEELENGQRKLLPPPELCSSDQVKRRPMAFDKHFNNPKDG